MFEGNEHLFFKWQISFVVERIHSEKINKGHDRLKYCLDTQYVQPPKWSRPQNDPQPSNDRQIDPEMIPIFLLVDPEMIPKELWNGD